MKTFDVGGALCAVAAHRGCQHFLTRDIVEVYALSLLVVPVNLAGVAKSIYQGLTKPKCVSGGHQKVHGRTRTRAVYLPTTVGLLVYWTSSASAMPSRTISPSVPFELTNIVLLAYTIGRFIGWQT